MKTDVLIIGGGMAGILCAYMLQQAGIDYILVEQGRICGGVTGDTTAKITSQHGLLYDKLIKQFGKEAAALYYRANQAAIGEYRTLCQQIDCDFETKTSFVYSMTDRQKLERELKALESIGVKSIWSEKAELPLPVAGAIGFTGQAQFHPLKFVNGIAKNLRIYEYTPIRSFDGKNYHTDKVVITAEKTIAATHFPIWNKHGLYPVKLYQHRSYVLALENAPQVGGMYVDEAETGLSFRNAGDLLLLGGGSHRTGKPGGGWEELEQFAGKYYPQATVRYRWATQDCMSLDGVPYIGRYSKGVGDMYVATGFNKWGMSSAMVAAGVLCDLVQGKQNPYAPLFSPSRTMLRPQLARNTLHALGNLLTPTRPRCPHMGCALKWNAQEHSWDCPCHGSRFASHGKVLNEPATGDLKNPPA